MNYPTDIDLSDVIPIIVLGAAEAAKSQNTSRNTGQPGEKYVQELLQGTEKRIYDVLRMKRETFSQLCRWLQKNTELASSRNISIE